MNIPLSDTQVDLLSSAGEVVFAEDECAPDAETLDRAWVRLFGQPRSAETVLGTSDQVDAYVTVYASGRVAVVGPPRCGWTQIRVVDLVEAR